MKKIFTFLIFILIIQIELFPQCYNCNSNYPTSTQSISPGQTITVSTCVYGGEYSFYNVTSGVTYTWETCGDTDFDTQLTLYQGSTCGSGTVLAYNDDGCSTQSSIIWTANFTGVVTLLVSKYNCQNQSTCMTLNWSASGGSGGSRGATCTTADPFCTGTTYNFPAGVNSGTGETGPDYCCLWNTPNPVWYYLFIDQPGNIEIYIHSNPQKDLDFICWGPFTNIDDPCIYPTTYLTNSGGCSTHHASGPGGGYPSGNTVDCSYSSSWEEWCYIPNALTGQFYILLITNFSNQACNIIFEQTNVGQPGAGSTNCNIVICDMSNITATPTACNPSTNFYSVSGTITFTDPPTSGQLIVTDNSGASQTINAPFTSPISYTINNINSDGTTHTVTAQFTNAPSCTASITYNAPSACNMCSANAGPDKTVCGLTTNLEAVINSGNASYQWSPTAGIIFANVNSPTTSITATAPGIYTLTWNVTSTYGVTCTDQVVITFDKPTVAASASPAAICNGETSVLTANGANTYNWSHSLGSGSSKTVSPTGTITYTVTGTSTAGCSGTAAVSVTVNPLPTVSATASPAAICNGQTSVITASGANTYSWSGGLGTGGSKTVTPNSTTTYSVTGTTAEGCTGTATVSITVNPLPTVTATASPATICNGASTVLTVSGANTYSWSHTLGSGSSKTVSPTGTTTYSVTGTSTAGCTGTATVSVTVNPLPSVTASASPAAICNGATSVLTASGANTYSWSHSLGTGSSKTVSPASTTTYTVTGTTAAGCTGTATVSVTVNPLPSVTATASPAAICNGQTSVITASGASTYSWSGGLGSGASKTVTPSTTTTYSVTGTTTAGCSGTATVSVTVNPLPSVSATASPEAICNGASSVLTASGANTYSWSHSLGTGSSKTVLPTSTTTYTVTGTTTAGCTGAATVSVTVNPLPSVSATASPAAICNGASSVLTASGANTYSWSHSLGTGSSKTVSPNSTTTYTVTVTTTAGCTGTATVSVTVNPLPSVSASASPAAICNGASSVLTASGANTYSWNTGGNTASITVTPSSTTTYSVTGTSTAGCTGTATVSVTVNSLPTVTATASSSTICNGATSVLTASGANTYSWNTGGNTASITVTPSSTTTYTVTGTTTAGCTSTASITINVIQSPVVDYSTTQSHCGQSDGNIMTNVTGGIPPYIYQWSNGANTSNLNNISAGNYTLTVSDSNGCSSYISIILSDAPMPQANFAPKPQITTIDDPIIYFENYSIGASSYQWDFGDGYSSTDYSPSHKYDLPGVYYVVLSVSDQYGCTDTVGGEIIIRDIFTIYLPNTFTPNEVI